MAIVVLVEVPGMTQAQGDAVIRDLHLGGKSPTGQLLHVEGADDSGGFRVIDIWENLDAFNTFVQQRVMPLFQRHGVAGPPKITTFEAHNLLFGDRS
jgi:hypothetical protein